MLSYVDPIPTLTPETAQFEPADATFTIPDHPDTTDACAPSSTHSPSVLSVSSVVHAASSPVPSAQSLMPPALFAQFVLSALTTLEELSRSSPPGATERRRAATTLLRYLLGPSPRAPRPPSGPRAPSRATGFSAARGVGGDTCASPPSSSQSTPRTHRAPTPTPPSPSSPSSSSVLSVPSVVKSSSPIHPTFHYPPPPRHTTILPFVPYELPKPAHPANPFLARLIHRIKGAESPHHAAERIYDASHPEHKLELPPRRQFALHAPDSDLGPLLRARRIDHTLPKDTTSLTGLPITKTVISASSLKPCEQAVYTLTLAPPKPPRTNDWTIVQIERSDTS